MLRSAISDGLHASLERDVDLDPSAWLKSDVSDDFLQVKVNIGVVDSYISFSVINEYPALFIFTTIASSGQDKIRQSCPLYGRWSVRSPPLLPTLALPCIFRYRLFALFVQRCFLAATTK